MCCFNFLGGQSEQAGWPRVMVRTWHWWTSKDYHLENMSNRKKSEKKLLSRNHEGCSHQPCVEKLLIVTSFARWFLVTCELHLYSLCGCCFDFFWYHSTSTCPVLSSLSSCLPSRSRHVIALSQSGKRHDGTGRPKESEQERIWPRDQVVPAALSIRSSQDYIQ